MSVFKIKYFFLFITIQKKGFHKDACIYETLANHTISINVKKVFVMYILTN